MPKTLRPTRFTEETITRLRSRTGFNCTPWPAAEPRAGSGGAAGDTWVGIAKIPYPVCKIGCGPGIADLLIMRRSAFNECKLEDLPETHRAVAVPPSQQRLHSLTLNLPISNMPTSRCAVKWKKWRVEGCRLLNT